jgi:hypothetical protein
MSVSSYEFSEASPSPRPRKTVFMLAAAVLVLCVVGVILREPLFELAGSYLAPAPPPDLDPDDVLPAGLSEAQRLMFTLTDVGGQAAKDAIDEMAATGDLRFTAVLLEALIAAEEGPPHWSKVGVHNYYRGLMRLINDPALAPQEHQHVLSHNFFRWYAAHNLAAPEGYIAWKGQLLGRIDPTYGELFREGVPAAIRIEEIRATRGAFNGIPPLDNPAMLPAAEAAHMAADEPVFGVAINGEARAYPERIMQWHAIVNDAVGRVPVVLAYCPLTGSAIAYDARTKNGRARTFGSSGLLYRSNGLLFDREFGSLWCQFTGEPVVGGDVTAGVALKPVPLVTTTWADWQAEHPETHVLSPDTGFERPYTLGAAYGEYRSTGMLPFEYCPVDDRLPAKSRVYGLQGGGQSRAYPLEALAAQQVVNDVLAEQPLLLVAARDTIPVRATIEEIRGRRRPRIVQVQLEYDAGGEARAFDRGAHTFRLGPNPDTLLDESGAEWRVTEDGLLSTDGQSLPRLNGVQSYWFAWRAFHEETDVFEQR